MKNFKFWPLIGTVVAAGIYVIASNYFLPVKNVASNSTFDRGSSAELVAQCEMINKGIHLDSIGSVLHAHNRRTMMTTEKGTKSIFWVSAGKTGAYYPSGPSCVVEANPRGQIVSWRVETFE